MGDMFRSEEMLRIQLFLHPESLYFIISELGEAGIAQFEDLNSVNTIRRKFTNELQRAEEMERRLKYIKSEILKYGVKIAVKDEHPKSPHLDEIIDIETYLEDLERSMKHINQNVVKMKSEYVNLLELKYVLEKTKVFFAQRTSYLIIESQDPRAHMVPVLQSLTGIIPRARINGFELALWRITKGNVLFKTVDIESPLEDPVNECLVYKTVFVAFFHGDQMLQRIKKLSSGFGATLYNRPHNESLTANLMDSVQIQLEDLKVILDKTDVFQRKHLSRIAREWQNWSVMVMKVKAIFYTMNCLSMDVTNKCLIGECWVPKKDIHVVQEILKESANVGVSVSTLTSFVNIVHTERTPPTYNRLNKYTRGFQNLIDSYGIASYQEANPALYTIVTFPFLFAIMFGDLGHALILSLFAVYLIICEKKYAVTPPSNEILHIFYDGRYIMLLMGLFSFYTGFIYNDLFSKSFIITHSSWFANHTVQHVHKSDRITFDPSLHFRSTPYMFGIDPVWSLAENEIIFTNSLKMKLSIVFGVLHMIFGVCVSLVNFIHFKQYAEVFLRFIPQLVFLCCLFGWMVAMIFIKWTFYTAEIGTPVEYTPSCAPSILIFFINMMLFKETEVLPGCHQAFMFKQQKAIEKNLIYVAIGCIPILLLGKPLYLIFKAKFKKKVHFHTENGKKDEHDEVGSDIFIYEAIHTIEYVLGTVSHTASYLRLWALSLAHAQLSHVLWSRVMASGLKVNGVFTGGTMTFVCFFFWAAFTVAILVTMEGLSAFLHTLRLHWVEYMSKFYIGTGYPFHPFSFNELLKRSATDDIK